MTPPEHTHAGAALTALKAKHYDIIFDSLYEWFSEHLPEVEEGDKRDLVALVGAMRGFIRRCQNENAALERQLADVQARERAAVYVAEYLCTSWDCSEYQVIGICDSFEAAVETVNDYLHVKMNFAPKPHSLVHAPQLRAWTARNVERSYSARIYETAVIVATAQQEDSRD